jgi:uncharacterized protein (TIGR03382 family)
MLRKALLVLVILGGSAAAERPRVLRHQVPLDTSIPNLVNSHVLFMNRCANGCTVKSGPTDSRSDHSDIGQGNLTPFSYGDTKWKAVMACMRATMMPFNIQVTDVDPGSAPHFEVMVAGRPTQIGLPNGVGGIADYMCQGPGACAPYIPNALVFDFSDVWGPDEQEICATAAQEIAHSWTLDHVTDASDPMTYNSFSGMRLFKDARQCGSDCQGGQSPFGLQCSGANLQNHICMSTGQNTQDELKIITALFGPAGAKAPTLNVTNPKQGSAQVKGFSVTVDCSSPDGIQEVDISLDSVLRSVLTAQPYNFKTDPNLMDGAHKVEVLCATKNQATANYTADVVIGTSCQDDTMCPANFICYDGACIAGKDVAGGLGATCTRNQECLGGSCASDGTDMVCVVPCDPGNDKCPAGFGCLEAGAGGVCWPGAEHGGGGGCNTSGDPGAILAGLGFAALLITRRKR